MRGRTRIINVDISDYKLKHPPTGSPNSGPGRRTPASLGRGEIDLSRRGDRGESKPVPLTKCLGFCRLREKNPLLKLCTVLVAQRGGYEAGEILIVIREKYLGTGLIFFISRGRKLYVFLKIYNRIPGSRNQRYAFIQFIRDRKFYVFKV